MKTTGRRGDWEGAMQKGVGAGKSALMGHTHPENRKLYITPPSIGKREAINFNRGCFNNT